MAMYLEQYSVCRAGARYGFPAAGPEEAWYDDFDAMLAALCRLVDARRPGYVARV